MDDSNTLVGRVATAYFAEQMESAADGTARFVLERLLPGQMAAIARAILATPELAGRFDLKLPRGYLIDQRLPDSVLTDERATFHRNEETDKDAVLLANVGDDEEQSLRDLSTLGVNTLMDRVDLWVKVAGEGLYLTSDHADGWAKALRGLRALERAPLHEFAAYVLRTRTAIAQDGLHLPEALGASLPALRLPKRRKAFDDIPENKRKQLAKWRGVFEHTAGKCAPYLEKRRRDGIPLSDAELRDAFDKERGEIDPRHHTTIQAFLVAEGGWTEASAAMAEIDWPEIEPLFESLKQSKKAPLGTLTLQHFEDEVPENALDPEELTYLQVLANRNPREATDEDRDFYESRRSEIRQNRKLKAVWERFLFGKPPEVDDFQAGLLLALERFDLTPNGVARKLVVSHDRTKATDLFRELNAEAGTYFAARYRGLLNLLPGVVEWKTEALALLDFPSRSIEWFASRKKEQRNQSQSKAALQIKFTVTLLVSDREAGSTQFIWRYEPGWVYAEFAEDWERIAEHPFQTSSVHVAARPGKGGAMTIDLRDVRTMEAAYGRTQGTLVAKYDAGRDIGKRWADNLRTARTDDLIDAAGEAALKEAWNVFGDVYTRALKAFLELGLAAVELEDQAAAYAALLEQVVTHAETDRARILLLKPILELGTSEVKGPGHAAIVTPWHPLRLAGMTRKARRLAETIRTLLAPMGGEVGDSRLFYREKREELAHPFAPEITVIFQGDEGTPLALTDTVSDYTLHEPAVVAKEAVVSTNEDAQQGAEQVLDLAKRYLGLQPHQRNNLSVVLYDCDSARLPTVVVDKLAALNEDEEHARCQVILRHGNKARLSDLYQQIVDVRDDADAAGTSEITSDFMARMRIAIMADQAPTPDPRDGRPEDIVFLQDVIARKARLEWYPVKGEVLCAAAFNPTQWSRRHSFEHGNRRSAVYLVSPAQTRDGWAFISGIARYVRPNTNYARSLPARELSFLDEATKRVVEEAHRIGTWVANFDELLDRRQLTELGIPVIRYKQLHTAGRSLIVSSQAPMGLLKSNLRKRLLDLGLDEAAAERAIGPLIRRANTISGDIVLRAAKRGRNASELMGVVFSSYLVEQELGPTPMGFFFLDDYADWLGQREEQIADLLILAPLLAEDGSKELVVTVTEAKYVDAASGVAKGKESAKQLLDTLQRFAGALTQDPPRLDRSIWLNRLADMLVDGVQPRAHAPLDVHEWSSAIRAGDCRLTIRGYSHLFTHGNAPSGTPSGARPLLTSAGVEAIQEVFETRELREIALAFSNGSDPTPMRSRVADLGVAGMPWQRAPLSPPPRPVIPASPGSATVNMPTNPHAPAVRTAPPPAARSPWLYPSVAAWVEAATNLPEVTPEEEAWTHDVFTRTAAALRTYDMHSSKLNAVLTPNAALLRFKGSDRLTVEQVLRRRNEFLTTHGLRVIGVQPEPGVVAIAVARDARQSVSLSAAWKRWAPDTTSGNSSLLIGIQERDGALLELDPGVNKHAPHTLIAGSTGSGKSVLMQNILLSIAATNTPATARITLIDPKQGVDYFAFEGLPHLEGGGIIDQQSAALAHIERLVEEMDARYTLMKGVRASSIAAYNAKVPPEERRPLLWLIHDEFAEWMLTDAYRESVENGVSRLGTKARAAGIHLVFAAQRPDNRVFPMQLRANLGNRLVLKVDGAGTSEVALGEAHGGAEGLLGKGHLLAKLEGEPERIYAQVPYASSDEIAEVVEGIIRESGAPLKT